MDFTELLRILSVPGLKVMFEYNVDYDCHLITVNINDIEIKILASARDSVYLENPSEQFMKELRRAVSGVCNRHKEVLKYDNSK